jgi:hypothetical protein
MCPGFLLPWAHQDRHLNRRVLGIKGCPKIRVARVEPQMHDRILFMGRAKGAHVM